MNASRAGSCVCGHAFDAHEHYRAGTDCARCAPGACLRFRSAQSLRARLRKHFGAAPRRVDLVPAPTAAAVRVVHLRLVLPPDAA